MVGLRRNRSLERAGVNALRALLENAGHIVQQIDGGNDHGEDLYVRFVESGRLTSAVAAIQVKAGAKYRRSVGYAIPVGAHADLWRTSNIPVIGVVYDAEIQMLYWRNITDFLQENSSTRSVPIDKSSVLTARNVTTVCSDIVRFIRSSDEMHPGRGGRLRDAIMSRLTKVRDRQGHQQVVGGAPNLFFGAVADWLERHDRAVGCGAILVSQATIAISGICTLMLVGQFAAKHVSIVNPWVWTSSVVAFAFLALVAAPYEQMAGRPGALLRFAAGVPLLIYCVLSQVELSAVAARTIASLGAALAGNGMLLGLLYVVREMNRRRRVRAAYGVGETHRRQSAR